MSKLAIVGTRILDCRNDSTRVVERIKRAIDRLQPDVIISGGADGVDVLAEAAAIWFGYTETNGKLIVHRPTTKRFQGPGGYRERDLLIAQECTHMLRIACKMSTTYGSGWTAQEAEKLGKTVVRWVPCPDD